MELIMFVSKRVAILTVAFLGCASNPSDSSAPNAEVETSESDLSLRGQLVGHYVQVATGAAGIVSLTLRPDGTFNGVEGDGLALSGKFYVNRLQAPNLSLRLIPSQGARRIYTVTHVNKTLSLTSGGVTQTLINVGCQSNAECAPNQRCNLDNLAYLYCSAGDPSCGVGVCENVPRPVIDCRLDSECSSGEVCDLDGLAYFYCEANDPTCGKGVCTSCAGAWKNAAGACVGPRDEPLTAKCCAP